MPSRATPSRPVALDDKYALTEGVAFMTGVQALVRLPIEQARRDRAAGHRIGTLISGYPGSPLGGYDIELRRASAFLNPLDIRLTPGINEELAAANVWGTQMIDIFRHSNFDGVTGIWYGKSPGVDRSLDVFRHANFGGGPALGGMLALAADDPGAKSSTLPNQSELDFIACGMPVLMPSTVAELLELGLHGIAMSRLTGLWPALKCVSNLCDGGASVHLRPDLPMIVQPNLGNFVKPKVFLWGTVRAVELERHLFEDRLPAALAYARANSLSRITHHGERDRIGLVASGKTYSDLMQAMEDLGYRPEDLSRLGVRVLKLGMVFPFDREIVAEFCAGLEEVIVVEEKRDLIESEILASLYRVESRPRILGKFDDAGRPFFRFHGELDADMIAERIGPRLQLVGQTPETLQKRLSELQSVRSRSHVESPGRLPNYCSGCPHNRSTLAVNGEPIGGGIGCHSIAALTTQPEREVVYLAPMGAEGSPWIGAEPFVDASHFFQNVGDGTFFHSGSQSLRATVAAGVNITFKLLYNGHISMTGGQRAAGSLDIVRLTHYLESEGVKRTIVVSDQPESYGSAEIASNAAIYSRERYEQAVDELRVITGTTVLVFDQECAAELRRSRKRGLAVEPDKHIVINEEACEGCGDCGEVSNCMSVRPVDTELGRKTQIHQASCNKDYSCVHGDCPSFVTVYSSKGVKKPVVTPLSAGEIPEPQPRKDLRFPYRIFMPGIGGTGVITISQVLAHAAIMEGKNVRLLGQTGLAQKGGSVLASLTIDVHQDQAEGDSSISAGEADLVLAFDPVGLVKPENANRMSPDKTIVVGDATIQATADAVRHVAFLMPGKTALQVAIDRFSRPSDNLWLEAGKIAEALFVDPALTNTFLTGVAYQAGLLPIAGESIEAAIRLNGAAVEANLQAFRYGRLCQHQPERVTDARGSRATDYASIRQKQMTRLGSRSAEYEELLGKSSALPAESRRMLALRVGELIMYQDAAYARRYLDEVLACWARESAVSPGHSELTNAVIRYLYKLMAYKDEYEVARLLTQSEAAERVRDQFVDPKLKYNLHPPFLRYLGLKSKLELGAWFTPAFRVLIVMRRLRGTALDPFGLTKVRRTERQLIDWYRGVLKELVAGLTVANHHIAVEIAGVPERIRGYEDIKVRSVNGAYGFVAEKLKSFASAAPADRLAAR